MGIFVLIWTGCLIFLFLTFCVHRIEPILARIQENRSNVLCPIVDAILDDTLEYSGNGGYQVGGFTWSMHFTWENVPPRDLLTRKYTDPVR